MSKQKWIISVSVALLLLFSLGCGLNNATLTDHLPEAGEQEQSTVENQSRVNEQEELEKEKEEEQDVVETNVSVKGEEKRGAGDNHEAPVQQQQEREEKSKQEIGNDAHKQIEEPNVAEDHDSKVQEIEKEARDSQSMAADTTVTITIIGPSDMETFLPDTEVEYIEGETVLDTLKRVTKAHKIQLEYRGRNARAYVEGINNVYEFDYGAESGWLYSVNGMFPDRSAGVWAVEPNDHIRWLYTLDLGKDWGATTPSIQE